MPDSKANALSEDELFTACNIPSRTTGQKGLQALLAAGKIQRIDKGRAGSRFRYFKTGGK
jgi:predicted transcriptional regulator